MKVQENVRSTKIGCIGFTLLLLSIHIYGQSCFELQTTKILRCRRLRSGGEGPVVFGR